MTLSGRCRDLALQLTRWPSVTGSDGEREFPRRLATLLRDTEYFRAHPEHLTLEPIGDGRDNLFALARGKGRQTVILAGHFDTVPVDDYGDLAPLACDPEALLPAAIDRLRRTNENPAALADFESGNFLPARGLLDMKAGLAAGLAALEAFAADTDRTGNLLFVTTPDEEDRSAGMRAAARSLPCFLKKHGLETSLVINLDSIADDGDGSFGASIAFGSIGKQLLTALVVGREAHACYPFSGIGAAFLAGELLSEFECSPALAESSGHEIAAPPTALAAKDLKSGYNVTTPARAWVYWNTLQHRRGPGDVLTLATGMVREAMDRATARLAERAAALSPPQLLRDTHVAVLTYAELLDIAARHDSGFAARLAVSPPDAALDLPSRARLVTEQVWSASHLPGPAVIIGLGSIPYAAVSLGDDALRSRILGAAREVHPSIGSLEYFPGISDMSFLGRAAGNFDAARANTPIWGSSFTLDASPGLPVINIGPWGRDYHHWLERLNASYAFETLPKLLLHVTKAALS